MNINSGIKQAVILAIGIIMLGFCIKSGLESVISKDRKVVVKGLAEKEVEADKVTWPIVSKEIGNDLPELYQKINATTSTIRQFLLANGVKASEINVNAPVVIDLNAERYGENRQGYRYNITPGYYHRDTTNAKAFDKDGFFHTGDAGYLKDGELYLTERIKDLFKTSNGKYI